jgi:hypothetical protein
VQNSADTIYCLMVTGSDNRHHFAKQSIRNFKEQMYTNKRLVIINHGKQSLLQDSSSYVSDEQTPAQIFEFFVPESLTLGEMRNISLNMVPIDAMWTVWDDDDYRQPNYLSFLHNVFKRYPTADVVAFTKRTEYNHNTGFVWGISLKKGFVTVLAKQDLRVKYLSEKNTMEDINLFDSFENLGKKIIVVNNAPNMYIRLVHKSNTSLYVDPTKKEVMESKFVSDNFREFEIDADEQKRVKEFMDEYFYDDRLTKAYKEIRI